MKNLTEFLSVCNSKTVPESEMNNFIREYTNNFDIKSLEYLRKDLNKLTDNIKFTLINETLHKDGAVEQQDRPTTVVSYLKTNKIDPDTWTPRQKVDFVLNDIENKKLNYYSDESIFRYEFEQYLKFSDMIEREYKDRLQPENKGMTPPQQQPTPPVKFTANKIIDIYDPMKVHKEFKKELKCDYDTFRTWFVDGLICDKKMSWKYADGNKTQLRSFIYNLCGGWTPKETNTAFNLKVDSNTRDTQINNDLLQRLEKCKKD